MAATPSTMIELGSSIPCFSLPDTVSGNNIKVPDNRSYKGTLVMFICNHCPFVKHVMGELVSLGRDYISKEINIIAISSNDVLNYPEDSTERMRELAIAEGFSFPYLYDESQNVAKAFSAACTPDFFLYDEGLKLVYRGQLDDSRPENGIPVTGKDLRAAISAVLSGSPVNPEQHPSMGCNIKWREA